MIIITECVRIQGSVVCDGVCVCLSHGSLLLMQLHHNQPPTQLAVVTRDGLCVRACVCVDSQLVTVPFTVLSAGEGSAFGKMSHDCRDDFFFGVHGGVYIFEQWAAFLSEAVFFGFLFLKFSVCFSKAFSNCSVDYLKEVPLRWICAEWTFTSAGLTSVHRPSTE